MTTEILRKKTARYLCGEAAQAEKDQIQTWLSCTGGPDMHEPMDERSLVEKEIIAQVGAYVTSTLFEVTRHEPWWKKITASF